MYHYIMEMEKTLEQIMEHPLVKVREFHEEMKAEMRTIQDKTDVTPKEMKANMYAWKEGIGANQEKSDVTAQHQEVPNKEAVVEITGTQKDQCGKQGQIVGSWNLMKR